MCWRSQMPECMNNITDFSKQDYSLLSISASRKSSSGQHETLFITSPLLKSLIALKLMLFPVLKHYCILQSLKLKTWRKVKTTLCQVQCSIHLSAGGLNKSSTVESCGIRISVSKILKSMNLLTWCCLWCQGCSRICLQPMGHSGVYWPPLKVPAPCTSLAENSPSDAHPSVVLDWK